MGSSSSRTAREHAQQPRSPVTTNEQPSNTFLRHPVRDMLIQPPPDKSIRDSWTALSRAIAEHVDTFYAPTTTTTTASSRTPKEGDLANQLHKGFAIVDNSRDARNLAAQLCSKTPATRALGLRICIAKVVLAGTDFYGDPADTALDTATVEMLGRFKALNSMRSPEEKEALASWRMLTAFFLQNDKPAPTETPKCECMQTLREVLQPFTQHHHHHHHHQSSASAQQADAHEDSLRDLVSQAVKIAHGLFCHPSEWTVDWDRRISSSPRRGSDGHKPNDGGEDGDKRPAAAIVVFPALYRASKRSGKRLRIRDAVVVVPPKTGE